jgi:hypothetical protein
MLVGRLSQAQQTVVVVVPHTGIVDYDVFEHRLRSELIAAGFQPISLEVQVEVDPKILKRSASRLASPAAISISIHDGTVSGLVWLKGSDPSSDSVRPVPACALTDQAPSVFAVRATDILHGGLLELGYVSPSASATAGENEPSSPPAEPGAARPSPQPANSAGAIPPEPPPTSPARVKQSAPQKPPLPPSSKPVSWGPSPASKDWRLAAMGTLGAHFVNSPTSFGVSISAIRRVYGDFGIGLRGTYFAGVEEKTPRFPNDTATVTEAHLGARAEYLQRASETIFLFEFLETGAHGVFVSGNANSVNARGGSGYSYSGYSGGGLGAIWWQNSILGLMFETGLVYPWKPADVLVGGETVLKAAQPTLMFNLGVELAI